MDLISSFKIYNTNRLIVYFLGQKGGASDDIYKEERFSINT